MGWPRRVDAFVTFVHANAVPVLALAAAEAHGWKRIAFALGSALLLWMWFSGFKSTCSIHRSLGVLDGLSKAAR